MFCQQVPLNEEGQNRWTGEGKRESGRPGGNSRPAGYTHRQLSTNAASIRSARSKTSASTFRKTPQQRNRRLRAQIQPLTQHAMWWITVTVPLPILTPPSPPLTHAMAAVEVLHAGWASKEGGLVKNWKRRYFVLRTRLTGDRLCPENANATHILLYFKSTGQALAGEASTGAIPITPGATVVTEHVKKDKRCVKITSPGDTRAYFLVSEGGGVGNASWIEALTTLSTPDNAAELRRMTLGDHPPAAVKHLDGQQENAAGGSHASAKLSSLLFRDMGEPKDPTCTPFAAAAAAAATLPWHAPPTSAPCL